MDSGRETPVDLKSGDLEVPQKDVGSYVSAGNTIYSKVILFLSEPRKNETKRFYLTSISKLKIAPRFFMTALTYDARQENIKVGMYSPDRHVRVFAKVEKCKSNCCWNWFCAFTLLCRLNRALTQKLQQFFSPSFFSLVY